MRYLLWQWHAVTLIVAAHSAISNMASASERPNILLILTDDQG